MIKASDIGLFVNQLKLEVGLMVERQVVLVQWYRNILIINLYARPKSHSMLVLSATHGTNGLCMRQGYER